MSKFKSLGLNDTLLQAITDMGFETPSEVQEKTIPILLEKDIDLVALAQTGTGKTAAFGFPMLQKIDVKSRTTQGLILSPTRELCLQITNELKLYGKHEKGLIKRVREHSKLSNANHEEFIDDIWELQSWLLEAADREDINIIPNLNVEDTVREILEIASQVIIKRFPPEHEAINSND